MEISDCDVLIVEGHVEATVNSKAMQIAKPGTLKGVAVIDVAEIDGEFSGELTAHAKLIVRGTGRVSGKIRYGRLIVADGGETLRRRAADRARSSPSRPRARLGTCRAGHATAIVAAAAGLNTGAAAAHAVQTTSR